MNYYLTFIFSDDGTWEYAFRSNFANDPRPSTYKGDVNV